MARRPSSQETAEFLAAVEARDTKRFRRLVWDESSGVRWKEILDKLPDKDREWAFATAYR
jgi:hypothetical protein